MNSDSGLNAVLNDRYKLLERVGTGGMAGVYKAQDLVLGRQVAVKVLHAALTGDELFLEKFRKEAHAVANLTHPNIVTVHDIGQDGDSHYIVMEFVDGATLKQVIRRQAGGNPLSVRHALDLTIKICAGLGYAHRAGLVHCDMKPQNVLVTPSERVKVTDFGIARAISEVTSHNPSQVWGTPHYFSPEQAQGQPATPASDVYSLGIVLYELLTGKLPFSAESQTALALKHINEIPPSVNSINPAVPQQLTEIVNKALSKDPEKRFNTAGQFGRILATYRQHGHEETPSAGIRPARQTTAVHRRPPPPIVPHAPITPQDTAQRSRPQPPPPTPPSPTPTPTAAAPVAESASPVDWIAIVLGLVAFTALVGLIPLWYLVAVEWGIF